MSDARSPEHDSMVEELGAYLIGGLEPDETRDVRRHLEECEECRAILAKLEGMNELLEAATLSEPPPDGLKERIIADIEGRAAAQRAETSAALSAAVSGSVTHLDDARPGRSTGISISAFAVAAMLFFILGIGASFVIRGPGSTVAPTQSSEASPSPAPSKLPPLKLLAATSPATETPAPSASPGASRTAIGSATPGGNASPPPASDMGGEVVPAALDGAWECDLTVWGLKPGQLYELWFRTDQGWLSAGTFRVSSNRSKSFRMTAAAGSKPITEIMVTAEPEDGIASPSQMVVLRGAVPNR